MHMVYAVSNSRGYAIRCRIPIRYNLPLSLKANLRGPSFVEIGYRVEG